MDGQHCGRTREHERKHSNKNKGQKKKKKSYVTPAIWQNRNRRIYLPTRTSRPLSTNKEKIHCKWNKSSIMTNSNAEEQKGENYIERMIGKMGD